MVSGYEELEKHVWMVAGQRQQCHSSAMVVSNSYGVSLDVNKIGSDLGAREFFFYVFKFIL